jgi:very-short-patch-repair endonuclease
MHVVRELVARGGIARISTLRRAGVTEHALRQAIRRGAVFSVCRGWVAQPDCDPMLIAAAKRGVVLSCITLASRRGLWVSSADGVHVAAPPGSGHAGAVQGTVHWSKPLFARDPDALEDSVENALILVARCQPYEDALATWESALRLQVVDPDVFVRVHLPPAARRLLADARPFSDAGTETIFRTRLAWLRLSITPQVWLWGHRVDFVIGERLVVQIDGGHHVGAQRSRDIAHDTELMLRGYHVIRIGYDQLMNQWASVQAQILAAVAQRLHLAS